MNFTCSGIILTAVLLAAVASLSLASPSDELQVKVYAGPTKCSNKNLKEDEKPNKVEADCIVGLHFTVTVDESTVGSRETAGKKVESSRDKGIAPSFPVGQGKVIAGLDRGLIGLCKGASAYIIVPPHLAYGRMGKPEQGVGADATLRYDVEIITIEPPVPNDFKKIDANRDWKISRGEARRYFEGLGQAINLDALWDEEDKDDDGYISWEEFNGPKGADPPPEKQKPRQEKQQQQQQQQQHQSGEANDVVGFFKDMDADSDGRLSKGELANAFMAMGQEMTEEFWAESDPDGDGYVTFDEFVGSDGKEAGKGEDL